MHSSRLFWINTKCWTLVYPLKSDPQSIYMQLTVGRSNVNCWYNWVLHLLCTVEPLLTAISLQRPLFSADSPYNDCCFDLSTTATSLRACLHRGGGPQMGEVICGVSPHLSCKPDQIKMRHYMNRRVTPPERVTSPTWGPPTQSKQALKRLLAFVPKVTVVERFNCISLIIKWSQIAKPTSYRKAKEIKNLH